MVHCKGVPFWKDPTSFVLAGQKEVYFFLTETGLYGGQKKTTPTSFELDHRVHLQATSVACLSNRYVC